MPLLRDVVESDGVYQCEDCGRPVAEGEALWEWQSFDASVVGMPLCEACATKQLYSELFVAFEDFEDPALTGSDELDVHGFTFWFEEWQRERIPFLEGRALGGAFERLLETARDLVTRIHEPKRH